MIKIPYKQPKTRYSHLDNPVLIKCSHFGMDCTRTGYHTKTVLVSSGLPGHKDIGDFEDVEIFIHGVGEPDDYFGLATQTAGFIASKNNAQMKGLAPRTAMFFAKSIDDEGRTTVTAIAAGILWAIVQKADVIILDAGISFYNMHFKLVLEKAFRSNICLFTPKNMHKNYFPFVMPVAAKESKKWGLLGKGDVITVEIPKTRSTYLGGGYTDVEADICAPPILGGLALLQIQKFKAQKQAYKVADVYKSLHSLTNAERI